MRAIEFQSKISNNAIPIPQAMLAELQHETNKNIRVMVFVDESDGYDNIDFRNLAKSQFLKGYAESDSIYDLD
ncbi:MAG: hypothetical protein LBU90_10685 [Bacteroidales bacterium]|jgi:hypothetical protein|nr:hypothetical protein [Bacteroidales bacterium]